MSNKRKEKPILSKPELLAPAGSIDSGIAAIDSGADAVYAGLKKFNARDRAENMTIEEMAKLINYAHRKFRKVYLTMNTLIKESELIEAAEILSEVSLLGPDAVIVQDLGIIRLIRKYFPDLSIHGSTQMGVHNSAGADFLQKFGLERIILERQITLEEIRIIIKNTSLPLEIFVHGALCCSRSGVCLFSSWLGGWSGNRGKCKQPCRRRYYSDKGNGFFFSTNDLCLIDMVPELSRLNIAAFKIEGRLRGADYVTRVVRAYRMMIDAAPEDLKETLKEAKSLIADSLGRKWSHGFLSKTDMENVINHETLGSSGLLAGSVTAAGKRGFYIKLSRILEIGDRIRVQPKSGDEGPAITVTKLSIGKKNVKKAFPDETCFVHYDGEVPHKGYTFKIALAQPDLIPKIDKIKAHCLAVDLSIYFTSTGITIRVDGHPDLKWEYLMEIEPADKWPIDKLSVKKEFLKAATGDIVARSIDIYSEQDLFVPLSKLKSIRMEFWEWAEKAISMDAYMKGAGDAVSSMKREIEKTVQQLNLKPVKTVKVPKKANNEIDDSITVREVNDYQSAADEIIIPDFCTEQELPHLKIKINELIEKGIGRFRVTSLFGIELLSQIGVSNCVITTSYPLPVTNSFALEELIDCGVDRACAWIELEKEALEELFRRCGDRLEQYVYGRIPVLSTRARVPVSGEITDSRGISFTVKEKSGQTSVYPDIVLSQSQIKKNISVFIDLSSAELNEGDVSLFNYEHTFL